MRPTRRQNDGEVRSRAEDLVDRTNDLRDTLETFETRDTTTSHEPVGKVEVNDV